MNLQQVPLIRVLLGAAVLASLAPAQLTWTEIPTPVAPPARYGHQMVVEWPSFFIVLFGGTDGTRAFGDTWVFDVDRWRQVATTGPSPRSGHALSEGGIQGHLLLFGGRDAAGQLNQETWSWNGQSWRQLPIALPPSPRAGHTLTMDAFDPQGSCALFGGRTASGLSQETWRLDMRGWTRIVTAHAPAAREGHVCWSWGRLHMRVAGGQDDTQVFDDLWEFDGADWRLLAQDPALRRAEAAFVRQGFPRQRSLLAGGRGPQGLRSDSTELSNTDEWLLHRTAGALPALRSSAAVFQSPVNEGVVLFGGVDSGGRAHGGTWQLRPRILGSAEVVGPQGCGPGPWGPNGTAVIPHRHPMLGGTTPVQVFTAGASVPGVLLLGAGSDFVQIGACPLLAAPLVAIPFASSAIGLVQLALPVPFVPTLAGGIVGMQAVALETSGFAVSSVFRLTLGD